jgi:outer membrane usher protein
MRWVTRPCDGRLRKPAKDLRRTDRCRFPVKATRVQSRPSRVLLSVTKRGPALVWAIAILAFAHPPRAEEAAHELQFISTDGQHIVARREELEEIGLNIGTDNLKDGIVPLDGIEGLTYRYDVPKQRLYVTINDGLRKTTFYDAGARHAAPPAAKADFGGVLNYNRFAASNGRLNSSTFGFNGVSATLDARAFSPFGTLSQSTILHAIGASTPVALRLDTDFTYSDQQTLMTYRAGDASTSGLSWTRPIRRGGFQAQRNFGLRSDLITVALASASGSAAVPSTVDVYVNNLS